MAETITGILGSIRGDRDGDFAGRVAGLTISGDELPERLVDEVTGAFLVTATDFLASPDGAGTIGDDPFGTGGTGFGAEPFPADDPVFGTGGDAFASGTAAGFPFEDTDLAAAGDETPEAGFPGFDDTDLAADRFDFAGSGFGVERFGLGDDGAEADGLGSADGPEDGGLAEGFLPFDPDASFDFFAIGFDSDRASEDDPLGLDGFGEVPESFDEDRGGPRFSDGGEAEEVGEEPPDSPVFGTQPLDDSGGFFI